MRTIPAEVRPEVADQPAPLFARDAPNLDFLRAFAVLCVFLRHVLSAHGDPSAAWFQPQAIGIFGVMAFFVHTSLVLMLSLERQTRSGPRGFGATYLAFLVRRAFRVFPLSALVVLLAWFALPPAMSHMGEFVAQGVDTLSTLLANLTLTNNLVGRPYVIGTLWTLPLELQMYLFLPALFVLARRYSAKRMVALWPVAAILAYLCRYRLHAPEVLGYAPCFFAGVLAYRLRRARLQLPFWAFPVFLTILVVVYMTLYGRFRAETPLGWGVCLALALSLTLYRDLPAGWIKGTSHRIATYSYGIYLTHTFAIYLAYQAFPIRGEPLKFIVAGVFTGIFSVASFHLVERPAIALGGRIAERRFRQQVPPVLPAP